MPVHFCEEKKHQQNITMLWFHRHVYLISVTFGNPELSQHFSTDLNHLHNLDLVLQGHDLAINRFHGDNVLIVLIKVDAVDAREELLQVGLDDCGIGGLTKDLQQVIVTDEIETGELSTLFLQ